MISQLFRRRRAERLAQLLDQTDSGRGRHSRSQLDDKLATELAIGQRLATIELRHEVRPGPAFRASTRAKLVATAERQSVAPAQRRAVTGRIYADASPGSVSTRARVGAAAARPSAAGK